MKFAMLPKDNKKKKDARKSAKKDKDPVNKSGGKAKKKKWSKATYDKLYKGVPNYKLITPAIGLLSKGLIKLVSKHRAQVIYTRNTKGGDAPAASEDA
ncbi:unnamed protein product [Nyctereutes procyonoides]|uniref:(raccoon dog) hypothetical protein n=1 Tax=Nyctereutes procyonoides TaxID=34880 RepID=A0A811Z6X5_NYCPR|nr:unnamed protein product [Nyctereutes procyonoides]